MASPKPKRAALPLLLIALAAVTWMYFQTVGGEAEDVWEPFRSEDAVELESASDLDRPAGGRTAQGVVERTEVNPAVNGGLDDLASAEDESEPVLVRAEIRIEEDIEGSAPENVKGWTVVIQTWDQLSGTTPRFESISNAQGIAKFEFPGDVHIDWVSCLPPQGSGYGLSFLEQHTDLIEGDAYLAVLPLSPARLAYGRVVDQNQQPIEGAIVHAYEGNWTYGLNEWVAGFMTATTSTNGRFEFAQLYEGENWAFAVEPEEWLMVHPAHGEQREFLGSVDFEEHIGNAVDIGELQCVPLNTVEVDLVDSTGLPISYGMLKVEPMTYDARYLRPTSHDQEALQLEGRALGADLINVGDYREEFTADEMGRVKLKLVPGLWKMWMESLPGMSREASQTPEMEFHTNEAEVQYQLPVRLQKISGQVFAPGDFSPYAEVRFTWSGRRNVEEMEMETAAYGKFEFMGVIPAGGYEVRVWPESTALLPDEWHFSAADLQSPLHLTLKSGATLSLRFTQMREEPASAAFGVLRLESWTPESEGSVDLEAYWWKMRKGRRVNIVPDRTVTLGGLAAGTYEVSLSLPEPNYRAKSGSKPNMYERQRWTIQTGPKTHTLVVGE